VKRSLDMAAIVLASLLLLGFAVLSLRGMADPQPASARFGMPVADAAGALFYRVYLSRNLVIAVSGVIFLTVAAALPVFDMSFLSLSGVTPPVVHPMALALIILSAGLMWRRALPTRA